jgi:serine/threonine protein kinase
MMIESSHLFAGRYQIIPEVPQDWDEGRGGEVLLAIDKENQEKLVVVKRVNPRSNDAIVVRQNIEKEAEVLLLLNGKNVPKLFDKRVGNCNGYDCYFFAMEKAEGLRVENNLKILSLIERIEILCQLVDLLIHAHYQLKISNGDVDLKHLYWHRARQRLTVIDWGNARRNANDEDISIDYARTAEIITQLIGPSSHLHMLVDRINPDPSTKLPREITFDHNHILTPEIIHEVVTWGLPRANRGGHFRWSPGDLQNGLGAWRETAKRQMQTAILDLGLRWVSSSSFR